MNLFVKTYCFSSGQNGVSWCAASAASAESIGGRPSDCGVSRSVKSRYTTQTSAIAAGTKKHSRQLISARYPPMIMMAAAPIECEAFQIENLVTSSLGVNQCDNSRAQGGNPMP